MSSTKSNEDVISDIRTLEKQVSASLENINSLASILKFCKASEDPIVFQALKSLHRLFNKFLDQKEISHYGVTTDQAHQGSGKKQSNKAAKGESSSTTDPKHQVRTWIRKRYFEFINILLDTLNHPEAGLQVPALNILMDFERKAAISLATESAYPSFRNVFLPWIIAFLVHSDNDNQLLLEEFREKYFFVYDDVRHFTLKNLALLLEHYEDESNPSTDSSIGYYGKNVSDVRPTYPVPFLNDPDTFNERVYRLLSDIKMARTMADLNNFLVQLNPSKNDSESSTGNKKKRKRSDMDDSSEFGDSDDDEDAMMAALGMMDSDDDMGASDEEPDEDSLPKVDTTLLDLESHKNAFTKAWTNLMKRKLSISLHKRILEQLEIEVIPFMLNPVLLYDYLSQCYSSGGVLAMLSLGGLFVLIRKYNVEYPDFFKQLYSLYTPSVFYVKQRKRFFQLSSLFLENANIPLYMVCAFLKRLSRLSLTASPQGCMIILSMIYNILMKHPSCQVLIHRTHDANLQSKEVEKQVDTDSPLLLSTRLSAVPEDPFNNDEVDPSKCGAIHSSLWELKCLVNHFVPAVATLAQVIFGGNELKLTKLSVSDFVGQSYQTLFDTEFKRKTKNASLTYQLPTRLFDKEVFAGFALNTGKNMMKFQDATLVDYAAPSTSKAYQEKKRRKSFAELKQDRKKKQKEFGNKRPRFNM